MKHLILASAALLLFCSSCNSDAKSSHHQQDAHGESIIQANLQSKKTKKGEAFQAILHLKDRLTGTAITSDDLQLTHTKKIHLFVIDDSLSHYQHIHPEETAEGGYAFTFTPETNLPYTLWGELKRKNNNVKEHVKVHLPNDMHEEALKPYPLTPSFHAENNVLKADWNNASYDSLIKGKKSDIIIHLKKQDGTPISSLDTLMGAKAHMAGFNEQTKQLVHVHPMHGDNPSQLLFHIAPEDAGLTKFFLQVQYQGEEMYFPFVMNVEDSSETHAVHEHH